VVGIDDEKAVRDEMLCRAVGRIVADPGIPVRPVVRAARPAHQDRAWATVGDVDVGRDRVDLGAKRQRDGYVHHWFVTGSAGDAHVCSVVEEAKGRRIQTEFNSCTSRSELSSVW
jgi:hypothetical protein